MRTSLIHRPKRLIITAALLASLSGCAGVTYLNPYPNGNTQTAGAGSQLDMERGCTSALNCEKNNSTRGN